MRRSSLDRTTRLGLTLVEMIVVLTIIVVTMAITFPVFGSMRAKAQETRCTANLGQIHRALMLYQEEYGGTTGFGDAFQQRLPPNMAQLRSAKELPMDLFKCNRTPNEVIKWETTSGYMALYKTPDNDNAEPKYSDYLRTQQEDAVFLVDVNHKKSAGSLWSPYNRHYGLGLTLGGKIKRVYKAGSWFEYDWWK